MKIGDVVLYNGEEHKVVWVYSDTNLEIKSLHRSGYLNVIPIHISELDHPVTINSHTKDQAASALMGPLKLKI